MMVCPVAQPGHCCECGPPDAAPVLRTAVGESINGGMLKRKPRAHGCLTPDVGRYGVTAGDEWTCGACGSVWEAIYVSEPRPGEGGTFWKCTHRVMLGARTT
jgi:hypothetical protein